MKFSQRLKFFSLIYILAIISIAIILYFQLFEVERLAVEKTFINFTQLTNLSPDKFDIAIQMFIAILVSLLPHFYFQLLRIRNAVLILVMTFGAIIAGNYASYLFAHMQLPLFDMGLSLIIGALAAVILKMVFASTETAFLRIAFSQFVSEDMLKHLLKHPDKLSLQGTEMFVTIMFLDIRGFTSFSEKVSARLVVNRLNELLEIVSHVIIKHGGHVNKFIGDSVMAIWGAPNLDKKQATHACEAALEIRRKIEADTEFQVGFGINYGRAIVGNIGSKKRYDYTVIGDTVNTASRLETATKEFNKTIIISDSVVEKLKEEHSKLESEDLGMTYLKGKLEEIHIYALKG